MMPLVYAETGKSQIIRKIGGSPEVKKHLEDAKCALPAGVQQGSKWKETAYRQELLYVR